MQPVNVPCYQTVPITTYEPQRWTVMKPVVHTEMIEQPMTECRPICEHPDRSNPHLHLSAGDRVRAADPRHGLLADLCPMHAPHVALPIRPESGTLGWMNRTGYEMRMAFTPPVTYQPPVGSELHHHERARDPHGAPALGPHRDLQRHADGAIPHLQKFPSTAW